MEDHHSHSIPSQDRVEDPTSSSLDLLDAEHKAVFRNALDNILVTDIAVTTLSEIIDGLPVKNSWLEFDFWQERHPVDVLDHKELCPGTREKARKLRAEFDVYTLSLSTTVCVSSQAPL